MNGAMVQFDLDQMFLSDVVGWSGLVMSFWLSLHVRMKVQIKLVMCESTLR